jgi:hypothetical protein
MFAVMWGLGSCTRAITQPQDISHCGRIREVHLVCRNPEMEGPAMDPLTSGYRRRKERIGRNGSCHGLLLKFRDIDDSDGTGAAAR